MIELDAQSIQQATASLAAQKTRWAATSVSERQQLLSQLRESTYAQAGEWAKVCCHVKGIDPNGPLAGEEWANGPMVTLRNLRRLQENLGKAYQGPTPAKVFPADYWDRLEWPGLKGETWQQPEHLRNPQLTAARGVVSLVLGAGNVSSISATDVLHKLFVEDQVVLLKLNPIFEALGPVIEKAFQPLVEAGYLIVAKGDGPAGALACQDPNIETIHVTGSHKTYQAILQTLGKTNKLVTAELGCVSPVIVVPGDWTPRQLRYQARQVAGMLTNNAGFNCNAAQVLVTCARWSLREAFLKEVRAAIAKIPTRQAYYPGATQRYQEFCAAYPQASPLRTGKADEIPWTLIADLNADDFNQKAFKDEAFCGILHEVPLDLPDPEFLLGAVDFVNRRLWGNLSASILIHPSSRVRHPLTEAIRELRYGAVGVNVWPGLVFALVDLPWGAFPGNFPQDIQSGIGSVHNTALVEWPEKTVLSAPFWTPWTYPWHPPNSRMLPIARSLCEFEYRPNWKSMLWLHLNVLWTSLF